MPHWLRTVGLLGDPHLVASTHMGSKPSVGLVSRLPHPLISAGTRHAQRVHIHTCRLSFFFKPKDYINKKSIQTLGVKQICYSSQKIDKCQP